MYTPVLPDEFAVMERMLSMGFLVAPAVINTGLGIIIPQKMELN